MKSAASDRSISDVVNEAVRLSLAEDAEDLAAFDARAKEPNLEFGKVVKALRRRGKI
jgi:Arc/MetJ-type ribon-helix-helix transcriptional regulator